MSLEGRAFPNLHIGRIGLVAHYFLLPASGYTLTNVEHAWRIIPDRIGLHDVRIHELRRTAASWLAIDGANLPVIQQVLNPSSLTCTQVYARLSPHRAATASCSRTKRKDTRVAGVSTSGSVLCHRESPSRNTGGADVRDT
ncbi:MAG: tyrosine-type recombinase/integrase [Nitrospira sp.]